MLRSALRSRDIRRDFDRESLRAPKILRAGDAVVIAAISVAIVLWGASTAHAQDVIIGGFPNNWTAASNNTAGSPTGTGVQFRGFSTPGTAYGSILLELNGTASVKAGDASDTIGPGIIGTQTFSTNATSNIFIPWYLVGMISFNNTVGNTSTVNFSNETIQLVNTTTSAVVATYNIPAAGVTAPTTGVYAYSANTPFVTAANVPAGNYKVTASFGVNGTASGPNGSALTVALGSSAANDFNGLSLNMAAIPTAGIGDSRAALNVSQAQTTYGVNGTGVQVAVIEPGEADPGSPDFTIGRITVVNGNASYIDEHTLAVSGIIAGAGGTASQNGIAPSATILSVPMDGQAGANSSAVFQNSVNAVLTKNPNINIINMSATEGGTAPQMAADVLFLDNYIMTNPNVTFVKSSGNSGASPVTSPGLSPNIIVVGGLNNNFSAVASYSSFGTGGSLQAPVIVAPSEYITTAVSNLNPATASYFGNYFQGSDYANTDGPNTGDISGTSFAAPMVSGTLALLNQYGGSNFNADPAKWNNMVMKAVLVNSASIYQPGTKNLLLQNDNATAWNQGTNGGTAMPGNTLEINRSLDPQLGGGMVNAASALQQYADGDVKITNTFTSHEEISASPKINTVGGFWDLDTTTSGDYVDYTLGDINQAFVRATLTWDANAAGQMPDMQLKLYKETTDSGTPDPDSDALLAETMDTGDNVKLLNLQLPNIPDPLNQSYYIQVADVDTTGLGQWQYGIAVLVPEPAALAMLLSLAGLLIARGKRRIG
jgi:hypothetical protein